VRRFDVPAASASAEAPSYMEALATSMPSNLAVKVWRIREGREADHAAKQLFGFSILYLFVLFAVILGEHLALKIIGA